MKKLILVLVMLLAFAIPVLATGTITTSVETHDFAIYTDTTEIYFESKLSEDMTAGITLTVNDLIFDAPITSSVDVTLDFLLEEAAAQLGAGIDISSGDYYIKAKLLGFSIADGINLNAKAKYNMPAGDYWAVANLVCDVGDSMDLILEARTDSDGFVPYSFEAQLTYAVTEDIDVVVGYEVNGWDDGINDWDSMSISDDSETAYGKVVFRF